MERPELDREMTFKEDAYYFAHYANMARHNAFLILTDIEKSVLDGEPTLEEGKLQDCNVIKKLDDKKGADNYAKIVKLLNHHFPFITCFGEMKKVAEDAANKETDPRKKENLLKDAAQLPGLLFLKQALEILTEIRNELNHYGHPRKEHLIPCFQKLFNDSAQKAKERMIEFDERFFELAKVSPYNKMVDSKDLTDAGKLFFLCLFLDKKSSFEMLGKVKGFKNRAGEQYRVTLECYTQLCCKTPYPKLESSDISLDILNELARCPHPLYQVLSEEEKKKFKKEPDEETVDELNPIMKRYEDRSAYLALRYFDRTKCLDDITFHLQLGRKVMGEPHRKIFDGEERTHQILKEMRLHDKLSFYETEEAQKFFQSKIESNEVEQFAPHYRMVGNRIGLFFGNLPVKDEEYSVPESNRPAPHAIFSTNELGALYFYNKLYKEQKITQSPKDLMVSYLQTMDRFIMDWKNDEIRPKIQKEKFTLRRNHNREEEVISRLKASTEHLQKKLDTKYPGLKVKHLPDVCREHLLDYKTYNDKQQAAKLLDKILLDTERKKKRLEQFNENLVYRSAHSERLKVGEIAQELARDIVFFLEPKKRTRINRKNEKVDVFQKINNQDFDILQNRLAYFPLYKEELFTFFDDLLRKECMKHPFLDNVTAKVKSCNGLVEFYCKYLEYKLAWLEKYTVKKLDKDTRKLKKRIDKKKITDNELKEFDYFLKIKIVSPSSYNGKAVFIPVGLFDDAITKAMKESGYEVENNDRIPNAAYWIKSYFKGATQPFYQLPRYYNDAKKEDDKNLVERTILKERIKKEYEKADEDTQKHLKQVAKRIRQQEDEILTQQTSDRVLFMMSTDLLNEGAGGSKTIENQQIKTLGFNLGENKILDENRKVSMNIYGRTVVAELPIKRYGEFRRFMKDRRLENLIKYFPAGKDIELGILKSGEVESAGEKFSSSNLAHELEFFDSQRSLLMKLTYDFEKKIYTHYFDVLTKTLAEKDAVRKSYIDHYYYVECAKKLGISVSELENKDFKELRNKIQHNEIPYSEWIVDRISKMDEPLITKRIVELVLSMYQQMNNELDNLIEK